MKDMMFYELMDHMKDGNCPICSLIKQRTKQAMDGFLYESVNDPMIRRTILKAHGLCNGHSRQLLSMGDPLAHALIYGDLLRQAVSELNRHPPDCSGGEEHEDCLFCQSAAACEKQYGKSFLEAYKEQEFRDKYQEKGTLCLTHLRQILRTKEPSCGQSTILSDTLEVYERLLEDLSEIRRKNDYRYSGEAWTPSQRTAWLRAVAVINDTAGLRK